MTSLLGKTETLSEEFVAAYKHQEEHGTHPLIESFNGLGYVVFKRTYARAIEAEDRTEEWHETVQRVVEGAQRIGAGLDQAEMERLYDHIWNLRGIPSGRVLWQLGTPNNERLGGDSLVSCWYTDLASVDDFIWMFHRLMLGGGVGFNTTHGAQLGLVRGGRATLAEGFDVDFVVPDNREGWGELLELTMHAHLKGSTFTYSTDAVRPEGTPIKTFGGVASGPGELVKGLNQIQDVLAEAKGRQLNSTEVLDIVNIVGSIVVSGNVRRSAQIALGAPSDIDFLSAKRWDLGGIPNYRAMSNNSIVVTDFDAIPETFWEGYHGNGEAYGMVNTHTARLFGRAGEKDLDDSIAGFNPCAEIALAHRESCNLAELVLPKLVDVHQAMDVARLLYKVQKAVAAMSYLDPESDAITNANMRLGLGVTGVAQASEEQLSWLDPVYRGLKSFDKLWSEEQGLPLSKRLTTVKPSGTLSLLAGVTPGGHPGFSPFHIRRVRMSASDPVFEWCQNQGYSWEWQREFDGVEDTKTGVVEFPVALPGSTTVADEVTAIDQLKTQAMLQAEWADNAVSISVYYQQDELDGIKAYLRTHWRKIKSVSFVLQEEHGYDQPPMEAIDEDTYGQRLGAINWGMERMGHGVSELLDADCVTGACPVR